MLGMNPSESNYKQCNQHKLKIPKQQTHEVKHTRIFSGHKCVHLFKTQSNTISSAHFDNEKRQLCLTMRKDNYVYATLPMKIRYTQTYA